jgi:Ulp1 family protease
MEIKGKPMNRAEGRLYTTRQDTPPQSDQDCGLYAVMFGMCVAMRLPLSLVTKNMIKAS